MPSWHEDLRQFFPDDPVTLELISAVEALPGIQEWHPPEGPANYWYHALHWGLRLWMTRSFRGLEDLRAKLAAEIVSDGRPSASLFAELSSAALCAALGAYDGYRVPRSGSPTPDWRLRWPDGPEVSVEVTVASQKEGHRKRRSLALEVAKALFNPSRPHDLVLHLVDPISGPTAQAMAEQARDLSLGSTREQPGQWEIRAAAISRGPKVLLAGGASDLRPHWWEADRVHSFVFRGQVAGRDASEAPPQVRVHYGVPLDAYINPVKKKVDDPQGAKDAPFLIAVNTASLPSAFTELSRVIPANWSIWPHVSGILLYEDTIVSMTTFGWHWRLLVNPHATHPLPPSLANESSGIGETMETGMSLPGISLEDLDKSHGVSA